LSNFWVNIETLGAGIGDSLFGFRVYPVRPLLAVMQATRWMRGYDFDAEAAVRLSWRGVRPVQVPVKVRYLNRDEGGISHFNYVRDNLIFVFMHGRLLLETALRLPGLLCGRAGNRALDPREGGRHPRSRHHQQRRAGCGAGLDATNRDRI